MRRLLRILWTTFAAVSLLCCVVAAGLWVRSYFIQDEVTGADPVPGNPSRSAGRVRPPRATLVVTARGRVGIVRVGGYDAAIFELSQTGWKHKTSGQPDPGAWRALTTPTPGGVSLPGFNYTPGQRGIEGEWLLSVHLAHPTALFALAPLAWLAGYRTHRRRAARARGGLCASCGYDLRASPGRCPECGAGSELNTDHHGGHGGHGVEN